MASVNFQRHINVHLHNALIVQKPIDESGKVAEGRMRVRREQSKIPKFKSAKEPGQSLTGAGGGGEYRVRGRFTGFLCAHKNQLTHELSQYDAGETRGTF